MPTRARTAAIWALLFWAACPLAQTLSAVFEAVDGYRNAIAAAEAGDTRRGIELALAAIDDLRAMLQADVPDGTLSVLESLSERDFARLAQLPGVFAQRIEVLVVNPEPDFFLALSVRAGDDADRRFASALAAAYRNPKWPVYVEPQIDYAGCTVFDEDRLAWKYASTDGGIAYTSLRVSGRGTFPG